MYSAYFFGKFMFDWLYMYALFTSSMPIEQKVKRCEQQQRKMRLTAADSEEEGAADDGAELLTRRARVAPAAL